jgi:hypothetical protein
MFDGKIGYKTVFIFLKDLKLFSLKALHTFRVPFSTTNRPAAEVAPPARKLEC